MNPWRTSRTQLGRGKLIAIVGALVVVAVLAVMLLSSNPGESRDERGDVRLIEGSGGRDRHPSGELAASTADIVSADIVSADGELVFETALGADLPIRLHPAALELRWELSGDDGSRWTLSAVLSRDLEVALVSDSGYGTGTVDDSLPGHVSVSENTIAIGLRVEEVPSFPRGFQWRLSSLLRAFADEPDPPRVEDQMPDEGFLIHGSRS
ncbi:MAG: hypothetical protein ACRDKB_04645 [Actinomycetota bacterium]